ncbi:unnamed protein product [Ceutorhynchus assimilis]|uniref:Uncharacterized protein n=1 Tax=Ceutorhynchus assimilis TaxID=467358 RepID=A0A9N9MKE3_9CUCU|nr:unnamed protein product [Ceutorhynchus assimilis]
MSGTVDRRRDTNGELVIDNVLSTQPELGPSIPDGGYGWFVFFITLFFQLMIPSLLVSFGLFLAFSRMKSDIIESKDPKLWDHQLLHVPLFFVASWTFFDPTSRKFISQSTWPKLFATAGTCLICSGLLFLWMGMTGANETWLYILAGVVAGIGASIQMAQCEILLSQYFRLKLPILTHLGHAVAALGFISAPIIIGHHILVQSETQVILWYQAIILQGLVLNLFLRKPLYLKSKHRDRYNYITTNPDDEEDIFSKNTRELQIRVQNGNGVQIQTHELATNSDTSTGAAQATTSNQEPSALKNDKNWVRFEEDEDEEETTKYEKVQQWDEKTEQEEAKTIEDATTKKTDSNQWETFEDDLESPTGKNSTRNSRNLHLEMSFGDVNERNERPSTRTITGFPIPLFSDTPVNNNNTYSYDALEAQPETPQAHSGVFMPTTIEANPISAFSRSSIELLQQPTFYKSLLTVMTTKWSLFVFFGLYPSFLFQEVSDIKLRHLSNLIGTISLASLIFSGAAFWINIEKRWRAKIIWFLSWLGALGYFMISDYFSEGVLLFGAVQIVLSIAALQHVGTPLLGLTVKGEATKEYSLICILTGFSFLFFVILNGSFKQIFRLMALLKFFTGSMWLANYIYKRLR